MDPPTMDYAFLGLDGCSPAAILTLEFKYIFLTREPKYVYIEKSKSYYKHIFSDINPAAYVLSENGSNQIMGEMYIVES